MAHYDHVTSPFAYAGNNPLKYNDPTGLVVDWGLHDQSGMGSTWPRETRFKIDGDNVDVNMKGIGYGDRYGDWYVSVAERMEIDKQDDIQKVRDGRMSAVDFAAKYRLTGAYGGNEALSMVLIVRLTATVISPPSNQEVIASNQSSSRMRDLIPNVDKRLAAFVNRYFGDLTSQIKNNNLVIKADYYPFKYTSMANPAVTIGIAHQDYVEGRVQIFVNPLILLDGQDPKMAYMIIGHELIHGIDQDNGTEMELSLRYDVITAQAMLETHAYVWNIIAAKAIGFDNSVFRDNVKFYAAAIPSDFDYNLWFGR